MSGYKLWYLLVKYDHKCLTQIGPIRALEAGIESFRNDLAKDPSIEVVAVWNNGFSD